MRHDILVTFIDSLNAMLANLAAQSKYAGKLFHVNLVGTLSNESEWANELHPLNPGFSALADKIDLALQTNI
jgi:hypothetical protein